jgi:PAS domain S-box-containing protein
MESKPEPQGFAVVRNVNLTYGSVTALKNVTVAINRSEVHAIVGEHGAGKSSLAHVVSGFQRPDSGQLLLRGRPFNHLTPEMARENGIQVIAQHNPLFDDFSVADNIVIDGSLSVLPFFTSASSIRKARRFLDELGLAIDPTVPVRTLNRSDRALVDIVKHLYPGPELLIVDETLENLSNENRQRIVAILNARKSEGLAILFITHRVDDIYNFADRITILRDGEVLATDRVDNIDKIMLIRLAYTHALSGNAIQSELDFSNVLKYNEAILSDLPINLVVVDRENRIKLVNARAKDLFGLHDRGNAGMSLANLFPIGNGKCLRLLLKAVTLKRQSSHYQVPLRLGGRETVNTVIVYPIFEGTHLIGNIIIIDDVTRQERLREQVVLSENLASVGLLAAGVAHEINNPLDIMGYYLENIRFNAENQSVRDAVQALEEEIGSIAHIVGNLISFSDKKGGVRDEFDIVALVRDLVSLVAYNAKKGGIAILLQAPPQPIRICASRTEVKQVILNLVKNAFEAMPNGGTLTIGIERIAADGGERCSIVFDDTGTGIDDAAAGNLFLPFYSTKKGSGRNVGLGLSISYNILRKHGGTIAGTNRAEGGCRFIVTLPAAAEKS